MPHGFHRVSHSLRADSGIGSTAALMTGIMLLGCWLAWAFEARVTRYEISDSARLELAAAAYPVQAGVSGRLISTQLVLGKQIQAGDVLAEIDSSSERLNLEEEQTHLASLKPQLDALRAQMRSEDEGRTDETRVLAVSTDGARAQYREADAQAVLAEREADRASRLRAEGILAEADAERSKAEAQSKRAAAETLKLAISRLGPELQVRNTDRDVRLKQILADIAKLDADILTSSETMKRLEYEIDRRRIRAPASGRLGEAAALRPGSHINEGQQLGVILPDGKLQVIAEFEPSAALGKVRSGQPAVLRLQGFPWAQYGTVSAKVSRVAGEIRDGKVRVELAVNSASPSRIPFQHGLPGSVEVQIERVSPAALVLRSAGEMVGAR